MMANALELLRSHLESTEIINNDNDKRKEQKC